MFQYERFELFKNIIKAYFCQIHVGFSKGRILRT